MKRKYLFAALAAVLVFFAGCDKTSPEVKKVECPFCGMEFDTEEECLNHQNECDDYLPQSAGANANSAHWMSQLSRDIRLIDLSIPGLHDAATYSYDGSIAPTYVKDQALDYKDAWNWGARAFDLRIGYDCRSFQGSFEDRCKFFHGDALVGIATGTCMMHNFRIDVTDHFPTKDQLKGECMILITKKEFEAEAQPQPSINVYEYLMRLLVNRYGEDSFIEYSPDLTLGDCEGKIILFTRSEEYTQDYYKIGCVPCVPVTYISSYPDEGETFLTVYRSGYKGKVYSAYVQDRYNVGSDGKPEDRYKSFRKGLKNHMEFAPDLLFFNGMNGVQDKPSWDVCEYMNPKVADDLSKEQMEYEYHMPLGIIFTDFYGVNEYKHGFWWTTRHFGGDKLANAIVQHNLRISHQ